MDWQSLTEKLKKMGMEVGASKNFKAGSPKPNPIEQVTDGRFINTIYGPVYAVRKTLDATYIHGGAPLQPRSGWSRISTQSRLPALAQAPLENFVYLDTETTGLSGGTGTMAFMVGAARFSGSELILEQFFLRNPAEEPALLAALEGFCQGMEAVVSYNGKSFDIPILNTRYILQGFDSPFESIAHFDLLALSRRIWRQRLQQCNLGNIEREILGFIRTEADISGYLVPEYYRDFLQTHDAYPLKGIFYHNQQDVVSLSALFARLADLLENPHENLLSEPKDATSLGSVLERMGETELALFQFERGASLSQQREDRVQALLRQAQVLKRQQNIRLSVPLWQEAAALDSIPALIELAKFYEHVEKNAEEALTHTRQAMILSQKLQGVVHQGIPEIRQIERRLERLKNKIDRLNSLEEQR